jgi:hypothetical protein
MNVLITTNRSYKNQIDNKELINIILQMKEPYSEKIFVFFTECSAKSIFSWCRLNKIPEEAIINYYKNYIKPLGLRNTQLDKILEEEKGINMNFIDNLKIAISILEKSNIPLEEWSFGGGTALMFFYNHRIS